MYLLISLVSVAALVVGAADSAAPKFAKFRLVGGSFVVGGIVDDAGPIRILDLSTGKPLSLQKDEIEETISLQEKDVINSDNISSILAAHILVQVPDSKEGRVIELLPNGCHINIGTEQGLADGDVLEVVRKGREVVDPVTGEVLGVKDEMIGTMQVSNAYEKFSELLPAQDAPIKAEVGDVVRPKKAFGQRVAVLPFDDESAEQGELFDQTVTALVTAGIDVVEREKVDRVMKELDLQGTDRIDERTAVRAGQLAGATLLVTGDIALSRNYSRVHLRAIDCESGRVLAALQDRQFRGRDREAGVPNRPMGRTRTVREEFVFSKEDKVREEWNIPDNVVMENGAMRIPPGALILKDLEFEGDFRADIVGSVMNVGIRFSMWGQDYYWNEKTRLEPRRNVQISIQRSGDVVTVTSSVGQRVSYKIKEENRDLKSPFTMNIYTGITGRPSLWLGAIRVQGRASK